MGKRGPQKGPGLRLIAVREASTDEERKALNWFDGKQGQTKERLERIIQAFRLLQGRKENND